MPSWLGCWSAKQLGGARKKEKAFGLDFDDGSTERETEFSLIDLVSSDLHPKFPRRRAAAVSQTGLVSHACKGARICRAAAMNEEAFSDHRLLSLEMETS